MKKSELSSLAEPSRTNVGGPRAPPFSSIRKRPEGPYQDLLGFLGDGYGLTGPTPLSQWPHLSAPARGGSGGAGRCGLPAWKAPGSGRRRRLASCSRPEPVAAGESPGLGAFALRCSGDRPACGFLRQCPVSGSSGQRPLPAVWHLPGGPRDVFSVLVCSGSSLTGPVTVPFHARPGKSGVLCLSRWLVRRWRFVRRARSGGGSRRAAGVRRRRIRRRSGPLRCSSPSRGAAVRGCGRVAPG